MAAGLMLWCNQRACRAKSSCRFRDDGVLISALGSRRERRRLS